MQMAVLIATKARLDCEWHTQIADLSTSSPPGYRDPRILTIFPFTAITNGLKQPLGPGFQRFAAYAARVGFLHSRCDSSLFIYRQGSDTTYLLLYVDDIVLTASSTALLQRIIASLPCRIFYD
ncbi:ribonuclease H-like domain-containing protein [Tanacetum coccineum]